MMPEKKHITVEGKNCWVRARSGKASFLVDAQAYFSAFVSAVEQAEHSIFILGWDIDSRLRLKPESEGIGQAETLGKFLNTAVQKKRDLHIYILIWDFSMIYLFERELVPIFKLDWRNHSRIHFRFDNTHPSAASHHQKIVVVDDAVAFSGGLDLTARRWDTPEHRVEDPRRVDPWGAPYHPFHDVQIAVDGETAAALGRLARERWRRATGQTIASPPQHHRAGGYRAWPEGLNPDVHDVTVAISRTDLDGRKHVKEIAELFFDMIGKVESRIYIENQYLTSGDIGNALALRLQEKSGPEMVLVLPRQCSDWLEQSTMGAYRSLILRDLKSADLHDRLRIYCPSRPRIEIHSKVFIGDDEFVRIGSANLSNRSLSLDTECDLTIEAGGETRIKEAIAAFRRRLLGEHLETAPAEVAAAEEREASLIGAVEAIRKKTGSLELLEEMESESETPLCDITLCDPERPVDADRVVEYMLPEDIQEPARGRIMSMIALLAALGALAAAWHWTPLKDWVEPEIISAMLAPFRYNLFAPALVLLAYAVFGTFVPITLMVITTVLIFDPVPSFFYSLSGCITSALVSYGIGYLLGRDMVRRLAGPKINRVSRHVIRHGFLAITFLRMAAVAPFTVINVIAGATRIRLKDYVLGTLAGMTPGLIAFTVFGDRLGAAIRHPDLRSLSILVLIVLLFLLASTWFTRKFGSPVPARLKVNR